jgi:hypothetical protein
MSIFDGYSGFDSTEWLREKSLATLEIAASLVDLANESDTTPWYAKKLKGIAAGLISRLGPMVALFYGLGQDCAKEAGWHDIGERGTFALVKWCKKWRIKNPYKFVNDLTPKLRTVDDTFEKSQEIKKEIEPVDERESDAIKLAIYRDMSIQMLNDELSHASKRILASLMFDLSFSSPPDIVVISKKFLPTDIRCTPEETKEGYRLLHEKGLIEKVDGMDLREDDIALKLIIAGINDSKHPTPYDENEVFGHPGIRIGGKFSTENIFTISFDGKLNKAFSWLYGKSKKLDELKLFLQNEIGKNKVYVENIEVEIQGQDKEHDKEQDKEQIQYLTVQAYYPMEENDSFIESEIKKLAEKWVKQCGFTVSN